MESQDPEDENRQAPVEETPAETQQPAAPVESAAPSDPEQEQGPELPIPADDQPAAELEQPVAPEEAEPAAEARAETQADETSEAETPQVEEPEVEAPVAEAPAAPIPSGVPARRPARAAPRPAPEPPSEVPTPIEGPAWFVIHCYSGYENKVRHNLEQRIETMGMKDKIFDVVIPTQEEIEVKDGKRRTVERHIFPGYVLVNMVLSEESWYVVRNTPGVTGFVGMGTQPTPLRPEEVAQIVKRMEAEAPTVKVTYKVGERVRIVDGPFNDFRGVVAEIDMERTKVRVMVSFFGRETPVELDFLQVEKA